MSSRLTRSVQAIDCWCRAHRHDRLFDQHAALCRKIRGHDAYHGITGNGESLKKFRFLVHRTWRRWLSRRHRKRKLDWDKFNRLLESFPLPPVRIVHSIVRHREANVRCEEPYALTRARTDLWEPGASNRLGPPGRWLFWPQRVTDVYTVIDVLAAEGVATIAEVCRFLGVNRTSFHAWRVADPTVSQEQEEQLTPLIRMLFKKHRRRYGAIEGLPANCGRGNMSAVRRKSRRY
jgi:hypothetical protein